MHWYPQRGSARLLCLASVVVWVTLVVGCVPQQPRPAGLVNPASAHCHAQGGRVVLGYTAEGREGLCFLPDGSLVDEVQLYRQDRPCE